MSVTRLLCAGGCGFPEAWCMCKEKRFIKRIVLSGGPCAGKSTILKELEVRRVHSGIKIITIPETAGVVLKENGGNFHKGLQDELFSRHLAEEFKALLQVISLPKDWKVAVVQDRGILDQKPYCKKGEFENKLKKYGLTEYDILNSYDHVIYMYSAARGAQKYYSKETNKHRTESVQKAVHICQKTEKAWENHPNLYIVDNSTDFNTKIERVIDKISEIMDTDL
jgi:predicted ATPase